MILLFTCTLFLNSALLFWLEPLFAKMILPYFGGAPAVWNTCMLFYQSALLAGYALAHELAQRLNVRRQILVHSTLFAVAAACLPVVVRQRWIVPPGAAPVPWLIVLLCVSIGAPLLAVSANSTLLQSWFSKTADPRARDPYFLYQASNLGSLAALLSYPVLVEPFLRLTQQSRVWTALYALLFLSTIACGAAARNETSSMPRSASVRSDSNLPRFRWLALAFVPSSLLLGVTTYITTSISPVPLLWIVPLSIYLATWAIAFGRRPWIGAPSMLRAQPLLLLPVLFLMSTDATRPIWAVIPLHLAVLFVTSMLCHSELAASRPTPEHLTSFYLWIAAGGALGGVFNAILGPLAFNTIAEYPITLALACLVRPSPSGSFKPKWSDLGWVASVGGSTLVLSAVSQYLRTDLRPLFGIPAILCLALKDRPLRFALGTGAVLLLSMPYATGTGRPIHVERSFFGVHRVLVDADRRFHWLTHGGIVHGMQSLSAESATVPLGYYHPAGPLGEIFKFLGPSLGNRPVAVIGLGTGAIACYGKPGQSWTYYEIDPTVVRIARDRRFFTLLDDCPAKPQIVLGDARLSLRDARERAYRWIILDAFSSDAIPIHLLTREALQLYLSKLDAHGLLVYHISNGYLDLKPVLGDLAADAGLTAYVREESVDEELRRDGRLSSTWVVFAREPSELSTLAHRPDWSPLERSEHKPWSDDFSDILGVLRWR